MPLGKTHDMITNVSTIVLAVGATGAHQLGLVEIEGTVIATGIAAYYFAGMMFSGDLDMYSEQSKRWGWFSFIWKPYQKMFKHRSFWSHSIGIGGAIRLLYLSTILVPIYYLLTLIGVTGVEEPTKEFVEFLREPNRYTIAFLVGMVLGEASHTIPDVVVSYSKKKRRRLRKKLRMQKHPTKK